MAAAAIVTAKQQQQQQQFLGLRFSRTLLLA
jgi:hypothetical protein